MAAEPGGPQLAWLDDRHVRIGGVDFYCDHDLRGVPEGHLAVMKPRSVVEAYADLATGGRCDAIVELGIHRGGSTALLQELLRPARLLAVELAESPVASLADYIAARRLHDIVRPRYGIDQGDRAGLLRAVDEELGDRPLDLVVDDASHLYDPTLASFEVLFPRLRSGGRFIIEDWCWEDRLRADMRRIRAEGGSAAERLQEQIAEVVHDRGGDAGPPQTRPLSRLALQLVLARAAGDAIAHLTFGRSWIVVERGSDALDPTSFRLADLGFDSFRQLVPLVEG